MTRIPMAILTHLLCDSSPGYSVHLGFLELPAISEADAINLYDKIKRAIAEHTHIET